MSGSSTGDETNSETDISLNDLSANHNNDLFAGAVAGTCVDALAHMEIAAESLAPQDIASKIPRKKKNKQHPQPKEDTQYLLADNSEYHTPVAYESRNLWSKAITTLAKDKGDNKKEREVNTGKTKGKLSSYLSSYDMADILDGSINGGEKPAVVNDNQGKRRKSSTVVPSSEFSIDGESAILWGDDPEKAYFEYMLEQEKEQRAMDGKDADDSLMAESARKDLLRSGPAAGAPSDEDDTTLGNPSRVFSGWDPSTVAGPSVQVSSLTPTSQQQRDQDGRLIIPNVIYVQDGTNPDPQAEQRIWDSQNGNDAGNGESTSSKFIQVPEQALEPSPRRNTGNKSKAATKRLNEGDSGNESQWERLKTGIYANRCMIGSALLFLVLTTGLVVALFIYRNNYAEEASTGTEINLDINGNPINPPLFAPSPQPVFAPATPYPTIDLFKKKDSEDADDQIDDDDDDDDEQPEETIEPTWFPTSEPTWRPTQAPSFKPTNSPTENPTRVPTNVPSIRPTERPSQSPSVDATETPSLRPTRTESDSPSLIPSQNPTSAPTLVPSMESSAAMTSNSTSAAPTVVTPVPLPTGTTVIVIIDMNTTSAPNVTAAPTTKAPSRRPTRAPSTAPMAETAPPTTAVSQEPTMPPSNRPTTLELTASPSVLTMTTETPTERPTQSPATAEPTSSSPTQSPTSQPTPLPTSQPTPLPTSQPTPLPTSQPTPLPTSQPTPLPTSQPTSRPPTTGPPSSAPTFVSPTLIPTKPPVPAWVALDTVRAFLLEFSPMSIYSLFDTNTSQYAALVWLAEWMASIPPQELGRITKRRLVQRWSLAVLYLELNGQNWLVGSEDWMSDEDSCKWLRDNNQGRCNRDDLVESLDLSSNLLIGTLPKEISLLGISLTRLEMDRNDIVGSLPAEFGNMRRLVSLDFTRCDLTGSLPTELGGLQALAILGLGRNDFAGTIPTEFGRLSNLVYLGLERNDIGGTIPLELTSLVNLEYLAVDWNALTGSIPSAMINLTSLRSLILARNALVGSVPNVFCQRSMDFLAADCNEVTCTCCDLCCVNGGGCAST